ncbi:hypothetical protein [Litoreibacter halocynthiae]|uniref:hypothetical protein n=1 Tax=Litoreibacter halocynthiae TaxID=1242689 RepID=UPI0024927B6B|nr:hypothetical protein [Litoreibacter halocynthiae]
MRRWLNGVILTILSWITVFLIYVIVMFVVTIPWMLSAVIAFSITENNLIQWVIIAPASIFLGVFFFWFVARFVFPCVYGVWGMAGWVFQKAAEVSFDRVFAFIIGRAFLMCQDVRWYFSKVKK